MLENDYGGFHNSPLQLAATELRDLSVACERQAAARKCKEVKDGDQLRRENAAAWLSSVIPLSIAPLLPICKWIGDTVVNAFPINTATRQFAQYSNRDGLHVLQLFGGVGLGTLRTALAARYTIRYDTYVDRDEKSRAIAKTTLKALQVRYPNQLPTSAFHNFEKNCLKTFHNAVSLSWNNSSLSMVQ